MRNDLDRASEKWRLYRQVLRLAGVTAAGHAERTADGVIPQTPVEHRRNGSRAVHSWDGVRVLVRSPLADVGSHGVHLGALSMLPPKTVR